MRKLLKISLVVLAIVCCFSFEAESKTPKKRQATTRVKTTPGVVNEITPKQFKQLIADWSSSPWDLKGKRSVIVDVYAPWCGPCKRLSPILEKLAKRYKGRVDFYRIDGDKYKEIMRAYNLRKFPTLLCWDAEGIFVDSKPGLHNESYYIDLINLLIQ